MKKHAKGVTLMELMVVIVIVAILAAVAVPLYVNYVKDAQRTEAKGAIGAVITAQQQYFQLNPDGGEPEYLNSELFTVGGVNQTLKCDLTDALKNWDIAVISGDANGFEVEATGKPSPASTAGRLVRLKYSRTAKPEWHEE